MTNTILAVPPKALYEAVSETLEVLGDQQLMTQLRQSIEELKADRAIPWEEAQRELET